MSAGGPPGGFDYNAWAAMNLKSGGDSSAPADTLDDISKKSIDKGVQTLFTKFLGLMNPDIEGHGVIPQETNVGKAFSLNQGSGLLGLFRDTGGILAQILKYFTRDLPAGLMEAISGPESGSSGSTASSGESGSSSSGDYATGSAVASAGQGGGGDFHGHSHGGGHDHGGEAMVNYGGKMVVADAMIQELGQLRPSATPADSERYTGRDTGGMAV